MRGRRRGGFPPSRNKAIVLHYSWRGCWGVQRENKSISTPVFHHQGSYQLDSEPKALGTRIQLSLIPVFFVTGAAYRPCFLLVQADKKKKQFSDQV